MAYTVDMVYTIDWVYVHCSQGLHCWHLGVGDEGAGAEGAKGAKGGHNKKDRAEVETPLEKWLSQPDVQGYFEIDCSNPYKTRETFSIL